MGTRLISTAGYNIHPDKWNEETQRVKKGYSNAKLIPYNIINARLKAIDSHFSNYEIELKRKPSVDELAEELAKVKGKTHRKQALSPKTALDYFDIFVIEAGKENQWSSGTIAGWRTTRKHLMAFGEDTLLSDFDENGIARYLAMLRNKENLGEASVYKERKHLSWFLRWCLQRHYTDEDAIKNYRMPKRKDGEKPVIYLERDELLAVYRFSIPPAGTVVKLRDYEGNEYEKKIEHPDGLDKARDIFCFCALTSLRYSDAAALRKSDIIDDCIKIVTKKTTDGITIELNNLAKEILAKYKDMVGIKALPALSNQKMNKYLKDICEFCGINTPITRVYFREGRRVEVTRPKYELVGTHAGRRTFICYAISIGIPPLTIMKWTGHKDYKDMQPYIDVAGETKKKAMEEFNNSLNI